MLPPTVTDIYAARRRLRPHLSPTPLLPSDWLSSLSSAGVFLKIESLNLTNSFKIRGALNAALRIQESGKRTPTIVTASAGNHGRALALATEQLGIRCVVFTPEGAPQAKRDAIKRHGAELHSDCGDYDIAEKRAKGYAEWEGALYVSPYNDPDVIAGAGTIGLELVEAMPSIDVVVVPLGGGGLASGVGLAVKAASPHTTVVGVEVEASTPFTHSVAAGVITQITPRASLADGLTGNLEPGTMTFPLVSQVVDTIVTVGEGDVAAAMRGLAAEERLIVEGAGAVTTAAIMAGRLPSGARTVVALVTGGNVDLPKWLKAIQ